MHIRHSVRHSNRSEHPSTITASWVHVAVGCVVAVLVSLTTIGYQAMYTAYKKDGIYSSLCDGNVTSCRAQGLQLDLMFVLSVSVVGLLAGIIGSLTNWLGPRISSVAGCFIVAGGSLLFGLSTTEFQGWLFGYILIGAGGSFVTFAMYTLPLQVPHAEEGRAFSAIAAAIEASAAVMLVMKLVYDLSNLGIRELYIGYSFVAIFCAIICFTLFQSKTDDESKQALLPKKVEDSDKNSSQETSLSIDKVPTTNSIPDWAKVEQTNKAQKKIITQDDSWLHADDVSLFDIVCSWPFLATSLWIALHMLSKFFYITSLNRQLSWMGGSRREVNTAVEAFSIMMPFAGLLYPITGSVMDKGGCVTSVVLLAILQGLIALCSVLPSFELQYVTMVLAIFNRFLFFGVAPYVLVHMYGPRGVNSIYGVCLFVGSCFNLLNYLFIYLGENVLDGNWLILNIPIHGTSCLFSLLFAIYLQRARKSKDQGYKFEHKYP
eukprot:m.342787 g.342787  ORF g.342787 m.342787 type:complete len:490 (+) comp21830_c0_seq1:202-1671(+)